MIPKRIHFCWFSKEPYPPLVQDCMASWKMHMPDWEYILWDYEKIKSIDSVWLQDCLETKKWAFAADFVRLWAIFHEGGVYLDSDVMVFQSFEPFIKEKMFIGRESICYHPFDEGDQVFLTSHCFGAEAGHPFIKLNLEYYQDRHIKACSSSSLPNLLRYDMLMMPFVQSHIAELFGYDPLSLASERQHLKMGIEVFPSHYFCWSPEHPDICIKDRYAQHLGQGSWREPEFWKTSQPKPYTLKYKIRWRLVVFLSWLAEKLDYKMVRIHPDGRF